MADKAFFRLDGRVALVTGGGQGIGAAICRRLTEAGAKVGVFDLHAGQAERVAREVSGIGLAGDVTSEADIDTALEEVQSRLGPVDILVNNAGIVGKAARIWELSKTDMESVMAVNLIGPFLWCRAVVPAMRERKYGRIVNIASIAGKE